MFSDIEIAQKNVMEPISKIAEKLDIHPEELEQYGHYKAKISLDVLKRLERPSRPPLLGKVNPQRALALSKPLTRLAKKPS